MKLGHDLDEIAYVGPSAGTLYSTYRVTLEGRPVMDVLVSDVTGEINIAPAMHDQLPEPRPIQATKGTATFVDELIEDVDGNPIGMVHRINERSVYGYVIPRLHVLVARLLLPLA